MMKNDMMGHNYQNVEKSTKKWYNKSVAKVCFFKRKENNMLKVAIATTSIEKIDGIKETFSRFYHLEQSEIEFYSMSVESGVPRQPFGNETYAGALNRVNAIRKKIPDMDFYISCEAGIENAFGNYFNVQVVCIFETKSQMYFWGKSAGWSIPSEDIEIIKRVTLDTYLREKGITSIEELLGTSNSRSSAVAQATELALASGRLRNN